MKFAVVTPTIREERIYRWLCEWDGVLGGGSCFLKPRVIVVEDNPDLTFDIPAESVATDHYCWTDIDRDLGEASWIIPHRTSAIKAYGFWKAWQGGADVIWTLDDDCYPEPGVNYLRELADTFTAEVPELLAQDRWWNTIEGTGLLPRGYPYDLPASRPVMVNHGLWSHIPDLDGLTQHAHPDFLLPPAWSRVAVPRGAFFPMCGMNLSWRAPLTPAMYFMLMGDAWGIDRFDDMFAGLFVKKICDHLGYAVLSGSPSIHHDRASDAAGNIRKETTGMILYEDLWPVIERMQLSGEIPAECYHELAEAVFRLGADRWYWRYLSRAMHTWAEMFS